ncbi:MAG: hypothetical protein IPN70_00810 [Candidatus Moraniibacteriota bacterium]|nr:MAG: hypothetical protein IPN70_00810 [Candidatus Moranbacteria bacterium]
MDKKSKILLIVFLVGVAISLGATYTKYILLKDYTIQMHLPCDPSLESCFVYECEEGEENCILSEDGRELQYYKLINKKAYAFPSCEDDSVESCDEEIKCEMEEKDCEVLFCQEEESSQKEECSNPNEK